jgi:hypothetical protein
MYEQQLMQVSCAGFHILLVSLDNNCKVKQLRFIIKVIFSKDNLLNLEIRRFVNLISASIMIFKLLSQTLQRMLMLFLISFSRFITIESLFFMVSMLNLSLKKQTLSEFVGIKQD